MKRRRRLSAHARTVLEALLAQPREWQHGYDLSKETGIKSGTLYPLLIRLSEQGLLETGWQDSEEAGRPPRHVYKLTTNGLQLARESAKAAPDAALHPARVSA